MGFDLFDKGGVVMYVLAAMSIYALAVIFYKVYQFARAQVFRSDFIDAFY